jgi:hypothetical protein
MQPYNDAYLKLYKRLIETNRQLAQAHRDGRAADETRLTRRYYRIQGEMRNGTKNKSGRTAAI